MSEKDLIEKIPNWEYTYLYEGSRSFGKSYIQHLLNEKDKEIERLNNIISGLEEEFDKEHADNINRMHELKEEFDKEHIEKVYNKAIRDKAIEYIENSDKYDFSKCELLDILKGSDKE